MCYLGQLLFIPKPEWFREGRQDHADRLQNTKHRQINVDWTRRWTDNTPPGGSIILDLNAEPPPAPPQDAAHNPLKTGLYSTESSPNKLNVVTICSNSIPATPHSAYTATDPKPCNAYQVNARLYSDRSGERDTAHRAGSDFFDWVDLVDILLKNL